MLNVICPPHVWARYRRMGTIAPALVIYGRLERTGGAVNLVAVALRPLRHLPLTDAAIASRDFR